ncbi:integrase core domain-containing protein [Streptomyces spectabilis]|uniref:integrase core domain-containing protein n=1 Tax=Streptomyces spectabilis TaxID=68270 RepID=UPI0033DEDF44
MGTSMLEEVPQVVGLLLRQAPRRARKVHQHPQTRSAVENALLREPLDRALADAADVEQLVHAHGQHLFGAGNPGLDEAARDAVALRGMADDIPELDALETALWRRGIKKGSRLIHHSDRGSQYVSIRYGERLIESGATASVGSVADSYDNAMAEALNGSFKTELIEYQGPWRDAGQVERAVVQWIGWYNTERLYSALDYLPPEEFEVQHCQSQAAPNAA